MNVTACELPLYSFLGGEGKVFLFAHGQAKFHFCSVMTAEGLGQLPPALWWCSLPDLAPAAHDRLVLPLLPELSFPLSLGVLVKVVSEG